MSTHSRFQKCSPRYALLPDQTGAGKNNRIGTSEFDYGCIHAKLRTPCCVKPCCLQGCSPVLCIALQHMNHVTVLKKFVSKGEWRMVSSTFRDLCKNFLSPAFENNQSSKLHIPQSSRMPRTTSSRPCLHRRRYY